MLRPKAALVRIMMKRCIREHMLNVDLWNCVVNLSLSLVFSFFFLINSSPCSASFICLQSLETICWAHSNKMQEPLFRLIGSDFWCQKTEFHSWNKLFPIRSSKCDYMKIQLNSRCLFFHLGSPIPWHSPSIYLHHQYVVMPFECEICKSIEIVSIG